MIRGTGAVVVLAQVGLAGNGLPARVRVVDRQDLRLALAERRRRPRSGRAGRRRSGSRWPRRCAADGTTRPAARVPPRMPQHSSGASRRQCATIASWMSRGISRAAARPFVDSSRRWTIRFGLTRGTAAWRGSVRPGRAGRPRSACRRSRARAATWIAPNAAAPQQMPHSIPSSRASRRAISKASSSRTLITSSMIVDVEHVRDEARRRCPGSCAGRA